MTLREPLKTSLRYLVGTQGALWLGTAAIGQPGRRSDIILTITAVGEAPRNFRVLTCGRDEAEAKQASVLAAAIEFVHSIGGYVNG